jgi:pyruvate ferredoxin oxidoreductase delta subunit
MGKNLLCEPAPPKKGWRSIPIGGVIPGAPTSLVNKTGAWRAFRPVWDSAKCINCMICVAQCPDMCILSEGDKRKETDFDYCKGCGVCASVCPVKCIKMEEESKFMK